MLLTCQCLAEMRVFINAISVLTGFAQNRELIHAWARQNSPRYRKHKPSGQAIVTLAGKDFYLGPHGSQASKSEDDRLIGEWLSIGLTRLQAEAREDTFG